VPDPLLILAPLLAVAVVVVLSFAGCDFNPRIATTSLTFRVKVPTSLTVVSPPGVRFVWQRPSGTVEEQADVTAFADDGAGNNVYEHEIPPAVGETEPEPGGWLGRCEMTVQEDGQLADATSGNCPFELPEATADYVLLFETEGSPLSPPFRVVCRGLS
jgi:hypothetical protein